MRNKLNFDIGTKLKKIRHDQNITQQELACELDISVQHLSNIENNKNTPSLELLVNLSEILKISSDYLLGLRSYEDEILYNTLFDIFINNKEFLENFNSTSDDQKKKKLKLIYQIINL